MQKRVRQSLAYLLITTLLLMSVPVPLYASTGDAPTSFTVSETGTVTFTGLTQGYSSTQITGIKKTITLTKVGTGEITNLAVSFSGGATSSFMTGTVLRDSLGAGVLSALLQVFPKTGLSAGTYTETVTITADGGLSESFQVSFTVTALVNAAVPVIHTQPESETVSKGAYVILYAGAAINDSGTLYYQWFRNTTNSTDGGASIEGANDETYEVPTDEAGTFYYYVGAINMNNSVNGIKIASAISEVAEVAVLEHSAAPTITTQLEDEVVNVGDSGTLSIAAVSVDGGTLSYQWYSNASNSTIGGTAINGANSATYEVPTGTAGVFHYYVVITNTKDNVNGTKTASTTSSVAEVTVLHTYAIADIADQVASPLIQGYAEGEAKMITIMNTGTGALTDLEAAVSGSDAEHFVVTQPNASLNAGTATDFAIQAKVGLPAATYSITVTISATNMSNTSFVLTQVVVLPDPPAKPQQVSATSGNSQVTLAWDAVAGATYYDVYRVTGEEPYTLIDTVAAPSYTVESLVNGTAYSFVIRAGNPGGASEYSAQVQAVPATIAAAPGDVRATAGNGQATIGFTVPADNGGSEITGYKVIASPGNIVTTGNASPIVVEGLTNGERYTFTVKAINGEGESEASLPSSEIIPRVPTSTESGSEPRSEDDSVEVLVNGKVERAGIVKKAMISGQLFTTIIVDEAKIIERLATEGARAVIAIPFLADSDVIIGEMSGQLVKALEDQDATVVIRTKHATYSLPSREIDIADLATKLGSNPDLKDIKLLIKIAVPSKAAMEKVKEAVNANGLAIVAAPLDFTISVTYGDASVDITNFSAYVERSIALPSDIDPAKITTGIVIEEDGSIRHVPTFVETIDGQNYARINSLTNSVYSVVWNTVAYEDAATHWASNSIHNMGARLIVNGVGEGQFAPDRNIMRGEFAAIMVRALGLKLQPAQGIFTDVEQSAWYSSAVQTAYAYGLISGFQDGRFRPQESITRQQAMLMISKAMLITGMQGTGDGASVIDSYKDSVQVASWAIAGVADVVSAGIVSGRSDHSLAPQAAITRAEVAVMIERLLQHSGLINKEPLK